MIDIDRIYNTDCLEGLRNIPDNSIDLIVTDPPYVIDNQGGGFFGANSVEYSYVDGVKRGHAYGGERKVMKELDRIKDGFNFMVLDECVRVMKKINIYLWCSQKQIMPYLDYFVTKRHCNWNLLTWHKRDPIPACGNKYVTDTEYCLFFREKGVRVFGNYDTKHTYYITNTNRKDKKLYGHPTCKPVDILENFIVNSSQEGDIVLDPFMGSGSTAVASVKKRRHYVGFEIDKEYHKASEGRLASMQQVLNF